MPFSIPPDSRLVGINRNDACPCGSGKKYKKCCLTKEDSTSPSPSVSASELLQKALALHQAGELPAAMVAYQQVLTLDPDNVNAMHLMGAAYLQQQDYPQAIEWLSRTITRHGEQRDFLYNLGNALSGARRDQEAITVFNTLLATTPGDIAALNNLGLVYRNLHQPRDAHRCFSAALALAPHDADLLANVGLTLFELNQPDEAIAYYQQALQANPQQAEIWNNLGTALQQTGAPEDAYRMLEQALALRPDYPEAQSNLAFCLDFMVDAGSAQQQAARKQWAQRYTANIQPYRDFANSREPTRRLRIGYVSADFRQHSAAYAFGALLLLHDRSQFDIICFSNSPTQDALTERFRAAVDGWHEIYALPDAAAAEFIRAQQIDILIDLSGHSKDNRLGIFAYKPAPVQATGWGHANGTGLSTVDYLFADPIYIPPNEAPNYAEKLRYLPCTLGYFPQAEAPPLTPLPVASNGYITFGCFSRLSKVSAASLQAWCELLKAVPDSHLIIKAPELNSALRQNHLREVFNSAGIATERVTLLGGSPWFEHLQVIATVDIVLDPFPHGGGVTILDCLWMGVPSITVSCPMPTGRLAAAILTALNLADWVAPSVDALIPLALEKIRDKDALSKLRGELRLRMHNSVVGNPHHYVAAVENEFRAIWREWCER